MAVSQTVRATFDSGFPVATASRRPSGENADHVGGARRRFLGRPDGNDAREDHDDQHAPAIYANGVTQQSPGSRITPGTAIMRFIAPPSALFGRAPAPGPRPGPSRRSGR